MKDSPVKKLDFGSENKENMPAALQPIPTPTVEDLKKPVTEIVKTAPEVTVAPGIKSTEADEPLLQENPNRFVLFPLK